MATNKFATLLHKNTHKITMILVYSLLEWILILLLLLNGFFSYLISKFASYFGLTPPCMFCSRVDHLFESDSSSSSSSSSIRTHLCDSHKIEVSQLGFCSLHKRLAEAGDMCEDCGTSRPAPGGGGAVLSWMRRSEMGEKDLKCSCCGIALESGFYSPYFILKPNWGVLEYNHKGDLGKDAIFEVEEGKLVSFDVFDKVEERERDRKATLEREIVNHEETNGNTVFELEKVREMVPSDFVKDEFIEEQSILSDKDAIFEVDFERNLIPNSEEKPLIELHDSISTPVLSTDHLEDVTAQNSVPTNVENPRIIPLELIDSMTLISDSKSNAICEGNESNGLMGRDLNPLDICVVLEEEKEMVSIVATTNGFEEENKTEDLSVSIGSEIPEQEDHYVAPNLDREIIMEPQTLDDMLVSLIDLSAPVHNESIHVIEPIEFERASSPTPTSQNHLHIQTSNHSIEDSKPPETPTRLTHFKESLDGLSETELTESNSPLTLDQLKSALQSKQSQLRAIYSELEEERISSAISANESMAMINRLQEEKAAMQMEALQHQRMMEEQSEYDQEALHLLNELVVKREREKREVERELEGFKTKVRVLERKIARLNEGSNNSGSKRGLENCSSFSSSSSSLGLFDGNDQNTPEIESDLHMGSIEETLDEFEEERISILEQLKGLEEKLFELDHEGEENENTDELNNKNNNNHEDYESLEDVLHIQSSNGSVKHGSRCKGKRLLPLFDEVSYENGEDEMERRERITMENGEEMERRERIAIEEEVGEVYERLQALEADREFLRNCVKSLKKGEAGLDLLQEILQHLRDLKRVELRVRNSNDGFGCLTV